ncbi:PucR family transcriptional regulator [Nonomuraea gerenzanensis]|uniref:Regulator of polyketide synthase expression n=1 Tax=Nonomuraea gerenzanensis TaxID=93944 RepID=A0A1M4ENN6_9ACTN|nr:PucR family transcriptional regulator [Nonomuraea gerenzanensis]UBU11948.1 helix-turn-helix domain-containing protein [Nonomuraea gerenzanensis]SBP00461.1 Regulator of polyketide synthase expression [Nonomuraea gerenzanensis]
MRLSDLLAREDLRLTLVTGADAVDREVLRAYPTDLPDPRRYLRSGDLVLTSGVWYAEPADCERFADALWAADVAGLVVGLIVLGELPRELVQACERRRLPLLLAAPDQAFGAISEVVSAEGFAAEQRRAERVRAQTLLDVLGQIPPGEVSAHLRLLGADPGLPTAAMAVTQTGGPELDLPELLHEGLARKGRHLIVGGTPREAIVLVNGRASRKSLADELRALVPDGRGLSIAAGISEMAASVSQLGEALETARRGMESARGGPGPVSIMSVADIDSFDLLLASLPSSMRRSFRDHLLGPVEEYDARHGSELLRTLDTFLETCGSWQRTADELYVHVNTLRYRMQRIEELTGRRMSSMRDRTDLYLALRSGQAARGDLTP